LRTQVYNYWDRGLLGMALDPGFPVRPYVYVLYTRDAVIGEQRRAGARTFTVKGAGADVCCSADAFHYAYRSVSANATIIARVATVSGTQAWTKAGVMIRTSTAAGSQHAFMMVSTGRGLAFQRRTATGGTSAHTLLGAGTAPRWVRLVRVGNVITASHSTNGTTWANGGSVTIAMPANVLVGLAVSSHTTAATATATFDQVTVTMP